MPELFDELAGLAEGAEQPLDLIFLLNCMPDLRDVAAPQGAEGCTTLLLPGDFAAGQPCIIAHNEDIGAGFPDTFFLVEGEPEDGPEFVSLAYAGKLPGTAFSINVHGLVQTINDIRTAETSIGIPRGFIARAVLRARTLDEALSVISRRDRASGYHHSLALRGDPHPLSVEAPAQGVGARRVVAPYAHANHLVDPCFEGLSEIIVPGSHARLELACAALKSARADPYQILNAGGQSPLVQRPSEANDHSRTIATAVFVVDASGVGWTVYSGDGSLEAVGRV
jgi:hypothetical protein